MRFILAGPVEDASVRRMRGARAVAAARIDGDRPRGALLAYRR